MIEKITKDILIFTEGTAMTDRAVMTHGTLYIKLKDQKDCDFFHQELRTFYREFINPTGGVNMNAVGDEFVFDFVPEEDEMPMYLDMTEKEEAEVDVMMNLEGEMARWK